MPKEKKGSSINANFEELKKRVAAQKYAAEMQPSDETVDKPVDKAIDKPIDKAIDKPIDKAIDKPVDKAIDKPVDKAIDDPVDKAIDKPVDKPVDKAIDKPVDILDSGPLRLNRKEKVVTKKATYYLQPWVAKQIEDYARDLGMSGSELANSLLVYALRALEVKE